MRRWLAPFLMGLLALLIGLTGALDEGTPPWQRAAFVLGLGLFLVLAVRSFIDAARTFKRR